jgi:hypothetical protein
MDCVLLLADVDFVFFQHLMDFLRPVFSMPIAQTKRSRRNLGSRKSHHQLKWLHSRPFLLKNQADLCPFFYIIVCFHVAQVPPHRFPNYFRRRDPCHANPQEIFVRFLHQNNSNKIHPRQLFSTIDIKVEKTTEPIVCTLQHVFNSVP